MSFKKAFCLTFLISVVSITITVFYKVKKEHLDLNVLVTERRILEGAQNCYYEDRCFDGQVTLKELLEMGYIKEEVNPSTKMYYSHDSYVEIAHNTYTFVEVR